MRFNAEGSAFMSTAIQSRSFCLDTDSAGCGDRFCSSPVSSRVHLKVWLGCRTRNNSLLCSQKCCFSNRVCVYNEILKWLQAGRTGGAVVRNNSYWCLCVTRLLYQDLQVHCEYLVVQFSHLWQSCVTITCTAHRRSHSRSR